MQHHSLKSWVRNCREVMTLPHAAGVVDGDLESARKSDPRGNLVLTAASAAKA